jgi:hypothetical protein
MSSKLLKGVTGEGSRPGKTFNWYREPYVQQQEEIFHELEMQTEQHTLAVVHTLAAEGF